MAEHREKHHVGTSLMQRVISLAKEKNPDKGIMLLANEMSYGLGKKFGFVDVDKEDLDAEIRSGCDSCPEKINYPVCHCRPMLLMP